jgi:hypothetical protein
MTLFAFRGVKSHGWTFYDPIIIKIEGREVITLADVIKDTSF